MSAARRKPETPQELENDIVSHPERGMLTAGDGRLVPAVRVEPVEVRGDVPHEIYEFLLYIWGAKGLDKSSGVRDMAIKYVTDRDNLHFVEVSERIKSEVYGVSAREVRSKKKGWYKARGRERKARLVGTPEKS